MINSSAVEACASNFVNTFPTNPDITGIGVRISLYVSTILGFLMTFFFPHDLESYRDSARTALVTSTSMTIAALYARYTDLGLSLFDAQIVTMLITAVTACYYGVSRYDFGYTTRLAARLHFILSTVFGILVYYDIDHFGGTAYLPQCADNSQFEFVIFSRTISATNPGLRIFALLFYSAFLAEFIWSGRKRFTIGLLRTIYHLLKDGPGSGLVKIAQHIAQGKLGGEKRGLPKSVSMLGIVLVIYLIVTVEQMIRWNDLDTSQIIDQWTFGQTIAVLMLMDQILKLLMKFSANGRRKRERDRMAAKASV